MTREIFPTLTSKSAASTVSPESKIKLKLYMDLWRRVGKREAEIYAGSYPLTKRLSNIESRLLPTIACRTSTSFLKPLLLHSENICISQLISHPIEIYKKEPLIIKKSLASIGPDSCQRSHGFRLSIIDKPHTPQTLIPKSATNSICTWSCTPGNRSYLLHSQLKHLQHK